MFDRFSEHARTIMGRSLQAAHQFNHDFIAPEHFLLGVLGEDSGIASDVLRNLKVDRDELRAEANALGHGYIGTEHVLLGLLLAKPTHASQAMEAAGLVREDIEAEIVDLVGQNRNKVGVPARRSFARLLGFDDEALPKENAAAVRSLLKERCVAVRSTSGAGYVIAFAPERDPLRTFEVGLARGRHQPVIVLHFPGETIHLPGVTLIELGENLENALAAVVGPGSR